MLTADNVRVMKALIDSLDGRVRFPDHDLTRIQVELKDEMTAEVPNTLSEYTDGTWYFAGVTMHHGTQWVEFER